ncbi:MAG TPA: hypothetical protein VH186_21500 [Chloroflexia bacterium]|nr:hypothetical protein [Chloroflexia bacterium]
MDTHQTLFAARESQKHYLQMAEHERLVRQFKNTRQEVRRSLKQQTGRLLIILGQKLAQEPAVAVK